MAPGVRLRCDNPGSIGDLVWNDANGDGAQNVRRAGHRRRDGASLDNGNAIYSIGKFLAATTTDPSGTYLFAGLRDGTTTWVSTTTTLPSGYTQTGDGDGAPAALLQGGARSRGGNSVLTMDFGYKPPATGLLRQRHGLEMMWTAAARKNGGELGIPDVTVCLYDSTGTIALVCTTTNASGDYTFPGVTHRHLRGQG